MLFIGCLLGLEQGAEPEAGAVHVLLCRVARPRARVVVLMCPLHRPCVFRGWLCHSMWLWGAKEGDQGRSWGDALVPKCRRLCWGSCNGGISVGYQECSQHCGSTDLGPADRAGGSGLCLAGNKGWTAPTDCPVDAFSTPYPFPHVPHEGL